MTRAELVTLLNNIAPVHYENAPVGTKCPFITYSVDYGNNFGADNKVYQRIMDVTLNAYVLTSQLSTLQSIEDALDDIYWRASDSYDDSEKLITRTYTMELIETPSEEVNNGKQD